MRRLLPTCMGLILGAALGAGHALAQTSIPLPRPAPERTSDIAKGAAAANSTGGFTAIQPAERQKIQSALLWAGDYAAPVAGEDPWLAAVKNFQKRIKGKITGELTPEERARLIAATDERENEFGWSVVVDPATGVRIGLPTKMMPHAQAAEQGTRWSSAHGDVQVETFRIKEPSLKLSSLFEQMKKEPGARRVEYSLLKDDSFFISGLQGLRKFSVRATMREGEVRGFTMLFDQAMETIVTPVMVAMSSAFSPFPERIAPFASLSKAVEYGNGVVVTREGHIITSRRLTDGCQVIVAAGLGDAERIASDSESGLSLLRVYAPRKLTPLAMPRDASVDKGDLTLVGLPEPKERDTAKAFAEIKARLIEGQTIDLRQPAPLAGFRGAAALDAQGRFAGLTDMRSYVVASTDDTVPPLRLMPAAKMSAFLASNSVAVDSNAGNDARAALVRIICVRK